MATSGRSAKRRIAWRGWNDMSAPSICHDCGRNSEFILHEDGCPAFGREVDEFIAKYEAEIASWPASARDTLNQLNDMHGLLFRKWFALRMQEKQRTRRDRR